MIGGQILDIEAEQHHDFDLNHLLKIHSLKTGALIRASAKLGCVAAGFSDSSCEMVAVDQYAQKIGLAFQVIDDLLDVIGDTSALGKKTGADKEADKLTFMNFYSVDEAKQYAQKLTEEAIAAIADYDASGELRALADYLLKRTY